MGKGICVEIDGIFYESCRCAGDTIKYSSTTVKNKCLSDKFPNYKIFKIPDNQKWCPICKSFKHVSKFDKNRYRKDNLDSKCKLCTKKYKNGRKKEIAEYGEKYYQAHKKEKNTYKRKRLTENPFLKISTKISRVINISLKGKKNGAPLRDLVDWTIEELIVHLESLFTKGMSWNNYGKGKYKWSLDHIKAVSKFNITSKTCQELKDCWSLNNLQPLWHVRNMEKGDKSMEPKYLIKPF